MPFFTALRSADLRACHETLVRVVILLLEGIRLHGVEGEKNKHATFAERMTRHESEFELVQQNPNRMLVVLGSILCTVRDYNHQVATDIGNGRRELQRMIIMLTKAMAGQLDGGQRNLTVLETFERQIETASAFDDLKTVRATLETCLASIQAERIRQATQHATLRKMMNEVVSNPAVAGSFASKGEDSLTGLPNMSSAQTRLAEMIESGFTAYAVALRLDSLQIINARYGHQAGDDFILRASQLLAQYLQPGDLLFRWSGSVLLAILVNPNSVDLARADIERLTSKIREHTTTVGSNSVMFRICASSTCLPIQRYSNIDALNADVNAFAYGT